MYSQYPFYDIYQNNRYADFALMNSGQRIAIKIEQLILSPMQTLRGHDAPQPHTVVAMDKSVWKRLTEAEKGEICHICDEALERYYGHNLKYCAYLSMTNTSYKTCYNLFHRKGLMR